MTRGQIAIITKEGIMTSTEFNGDMYMPTKKWAGKGRLVINALKRVNDIADYHYEVAKFNKENHHYCDTKLAYKIQGHEALDFTKDYFDNWFSDYVYIKNLVAETITLKTQLYDRSGDRSGTKDIELAPNQIAVLHFGRLELLTK